MRVIGIAHPLVVCGLASVVAAASGQAPAGTTVLENVYSEEQAKRGRASYDGKCASCHDGGTMGPELWGDPFLTQWENKKVGEFYNRIQTTMPEDAPGTLGESEVLDIIAYVLKTNGFPAGDKAIGGKDALGAMTFVKRK
jgi:mono/diheme cytochrome c family protein